MKIIKLTASNIKRLHAVEITPEGALVTIAGKNAQGKSSVLDSIEYALGGEKHIPSEPIRKGEKSAQTEIDLGDIIVTRKFRREHLECDCGHPGEGVLLSEHKKTCASNKFGETKSSLFVRSKEGLQYPSPQAVLNKLLGQLTFDPLAFVNADSLTQVHMLRSVVNLDTKELDNERLQVYQERTILNRQLSTETVKFEQMPVHAKEGLTPVSLDEIQAEIEEAERKRNDYDSCNTRFNDTKTRVDSLEYETKIRGAKISTMERELGLLKKAQADDLEDLRVKSHEMKVLGKERDDRYAKIPNIASITTRMSELSGKNARIQQNIARKQQEARVQNLSKQVAKLTDDIATIDDTKKKLVESVKYPVEGLGFDFEKDEVMFNELPFNQASKAEQIRVSVNIGLALNPKLRVLLIKDGNALDASGMRLIAELAEQANAQFWIERVAETKDGAMVMIEDGAVV
jgi:DNA repair exonuclease SbcCD ATPase subunit